MYVNIYYSGGECPGYLTDWLTDKINSNLRTLFMRFSVVISVLCTTSRETRENPVDLPGELNRS